MRERWGTFSVRDHISDAPFVSDVLLYDRLVIPIPDPKDPKAKGHWTKKNRDPELLYKCLKVLKVKTEKDDGLALAVPWDDSKTKRFKSKLSAAAALATQDRNPDQPYYVDPFYMTRELIRDEFLPALPKGVTKAWPVAAYPSTAAFKKDISSAKPERETRLATVLRHQFLTPKQSDPKQELLQRAIDLTMTDAFRRKRAKFYEWQEGIMEENISDEKAIEEMNQLLAAYNEATRKAFVDVVAKYAFTVIPIGLTLTGAILAGPAAGVVLGAASGLVQLTRFWKFDRKPVIANGDLDAAAMVHDAREVLSLK